MKKIKIYIAGPDVFRGNAKEHLQSLKNLCTQYGFEGLSPLDNEVNLADEFASSTIFVGNIKLINQCDVVIANIHPFRGPNVDDGTAFEIGYAYAKDKIIFGYSSQYHIDYVDKVRDGNFDFDYPIVEDFGLPTNLMLIRAIFGTNGVLQSTFENCLKQLKFYKL